MGYPYNKDDAQQALYGKSTDYEVSMKALGPVNMPGPISMQLEKLREVVKNLNITIDSLEQKCFPVLQQQPPEVLNKNPKDTPGMMVVPLAGELASLWAGIQEAVRKIDSINERIAL